MTPDQKIILYVDDDADDRELFCEAVKNVNAGVQVSVAENGLEALDYLHTIKENAAPLPGLILLDVNMPFLDGRETCNRIKADNALQTVPVVIFSSSTKPADKAWFNSLGVEFITKPLDFSNLKAIAHHLVDVCSVS